MGTNTHPTLGQLRFFGLVMSTALGSAGALAHRRGAPLWVAVALPCAGVALGLTGLAAPALLRGPYRAWMALGRALGKVTTPLLLGLVFVLVLLPLGALLRLLGKDALRGRFDPEARSYWLERTRRGFTRQDLERLS